MNNHDKIRQIVEVCSCNEGTALRLLEASNHNVSEAIERFLTQGADFAAPVSSLTTPSARSAPAPVASALKKSPQPSDTSNWAKPFFPSDAEQAAVNQGGAAATVDLSGPGAWGSRASDGRQVKFYSDWGASATFDHQPDEPNFALNHEISRFLSPWQGGTVDLSKLGPESPPRDSEGRVKRARPDAAHDRDADLGGGGGSGQGSKRGGSHGGALRFSEHSQGSDAMQLDSQQHQGEGSSSLSYPFRPHEPHETAMGGAGWQYDVPDQEQQQQAGQLVPYEGGNPSRFNKRPPSPPPRRSQNSDARALPANEDDDLERALRASLQDQQGGGAVDEEDPELAAAIQASMNEVGMMDSWYSTGSAGFGAKGGGQDGSREAGKVPDHLSPLKAKDFEKAPPALAAPFESLRIFPLVLHALYALPPVRRGFQMFEIERLSAINDMTYFWTGIPAGKKSNAPGLGKWVSSDEREKADVVQRLQILFFFMDRTLRPVVMTGSVLEILPQSLMTLNSGNPDPAELAMYTVSSFFDAYRTAVRAVAGRHAEDQEEWISGRMRIIDTLVSYGTPSPAPAHKPDGEADPDAPPAPEPAMPNPQTNPMSTYNSTHLELRHTPVVSDMAAAVLTVLEDDSSLVTVPGETLSVGIRREWPDAAGPELASGKGKGKESEAGLKPWRVDKYFYADPFLWQRRRGVPHGQGPEEADLMEEIKKRREEMTQRLDKRKWLAAPTGKDALQVMEDSLEYFEVAGQSTEDAIRTQTCQEAAVKLREMRDTVQTQIKILDEVIGAEHAKIAESHRERIERFRRQYEGKPEWQTVRYELRAVLVKSGESAWGYIQHYGQWFRVQDGHMHLTDEATALGDESGANEPGGGVFFLTYVRSDAVAVDPASVAAKAQAADPDLETKRQMGLLPDDAEMATLGEFLEHGGLAGPVEPPEPFAEAVDNDNVEFQAVLLSVQGSDSPTDVRHDSLNSGVASKSSGSRKREDRMSVVGGEDGFDGTNINLSGLLKQEHEQGSPSSSVVVEIDFRDDPQ